MTAKQIVVKMRRLAPATVGSQRLWTSTRPRSLGPYQLVEEGFRGSVAAEALADLGHAARFFDGASEAKPTALAASEPPNGRKRWTLKLLEEAEIFRRDGIRRATSQRGLVTA